MMKTKNNANMTLGQFVQAHRERMGFSLRELARRVKSSASLMSWIERDKGFPSSALAGRMADLFGVPTEEIKNFDDRISTVKLRRAIERNADLRAAAHLMMQEIDSGRSKPEDFARAIFSVAARSQKSAR